MTYPYAMTGFGVMLNIRLRRVKPFRTNQKNAPRSADQVLNATKLGAAAMTVLSANLAEASTLGEE